MELRSVMERLRETLGKEQLKLITACENVYHLADGENMKFYYKAGFRDAIGFFRYWFSME